MKQKIVFMGLISCLVLFFFSCKHQSGFPVLNGPYLGQKPPGDIPEIFAPGIVSSVYLEHSSAVFTPDSKELFWSRELNVGSSPRIIVVMHMRQEHGIWTQPELAPFNFNEATYNHINSVSPDGKRLYYFTHSEKKGAKSWVVDKTVKGWGEPRLHRLNTLDNPDSYVSEVHETRIGNIYCIGPLETMPTGRGIVYSKFVDGKYQAYESLGPHINFPVDDPYPNHSPTVDPDERFVIFVSRRPGGFGTQDLYISYRQSDGTFGQAINLGSRINTIGIGNSWPQLSPDGKYLFFVGYTRPYQDIMDKKYTYRELTAIQESIYNGRGNIYWVSTRFVEKLKPENIK